MSASCPECGEPFVPGTESCAICGPPPEIRRRLRERKLATILFADIAGATGLGETLDVERLQEVMTSFYDAMREEVEAMGGIVDTFVGDAVMAVFGVPAAHDDDPDRALAAARRMFERLAELNETLFSSEGVTIEMRIGVNTGDVVMAARDQPELGRMTGDAVNVAARLQEHATPGTVVVAARTVATATSFRFRELGPVTLRGRTEPVRIFELGPSVESARRSLITSAPIVGRDHELSLLETLFERTLRENSPYLVTVYGSAGVGKSRLVAELIESLGRRVAAPTILSGRCRPYGEVVAYGALAEIIKNSASILDSDPPELALAKIGKLVRTIQEPAATGDLDRVAEALAYTAGIGSETSALHEMSPRQIRAEIRKAWRWFFPKSGRSGGVVVLIEDIHWADPALLDLLEDLADRVEGPVLFLCPARPQLTDSRPSWGGGRKSFSSILLDPLTPDESATLVGLLTATDGLPDEVRNKILQRAEGNPFFIEEIIRSLVDAGSIAITDEGLRTVSGVSDVQIPDTVHAVIAARIDLLDPDHKRALQCAAVIGRTFWTGALTFLLDWEESRVEEILDGLEQRDLVLARLDSDLGVDREYRFRHVLIRDVAYETLSRRDRTSIHRWVAEWFTRSAGDRRRELIGLQAHHLVNAYDGMVAQGGDDPEAEQIRGEAFTSLLLASAQAKRRVALGEAKHFAREARRIAADRSEESGSVEALGEAFFYGYEGDAAWQHLKEAVDLRLESHDPDPHDIARMCARALEMPVRWPGAMVSPPTETTVAHYLRLGIAHTVDPGSADAIRLLTIKAFWQHAFPGRVDQPDPPVISPEEAIHSAEQAIEAARQLGRPDLESAALDGLAACHIPEGAYHEALAASKRRVTLVDGLNDLWEIGDTFAMNSWTRYHIGHYRETFEYADEGFSRTVGEAPSLALHCLSWRTQARFRMGDWDAAVEDYRLARRLLGEQKDLPPHYVAPIFGIAALVHEIRGEHAAADAILEVLRRRFEASAPADREAQPLSRLAEFVSLVLARRNRMARARELIEVTTWRRKGRLGLLLESAMDVAGQAEDWTWAAELTTQARELATARQLEALAAATDAAEGRVAFAAGDAERAIRLLENSVAEFARLNAIWDGVRADIALAVAHFSVGRATEAQAILNRALPTLERLGARREIDTTRDLLAKG